jgi:hypothetical protein
MTLQSLKNFFIAHLNDVTLRDKPPLLTIAKPLKPFLWKESLMYWPVNFLNSTL